MPAQPLRHLCGTAEGICHPHSLLCAQRGFEMHRRRHPGCPPLWHPLTLAVKCALHSLLLPSSSSQIVSVILTCQLDGVGHDLVPADWEASPVFHFSGQRARIGRLQAWVHRLADCYSGCSDTCEGNCQRASNPGLLGTVVLLSLPHFWRMQKEHHGEPQTWGGGQVVLHLQEGSYLTS